MLLVKNTVFQHEWLTIYSVTLLLDCTYRCIKNEIEGGEREKATYQVRERARLPGSILKHLLRNNKEPSVHPIPLSKTFRQKGRYLYVFHSTCRRWRKQHSMPFFRPSCQKVFDKRAEKNESPSLFLAGDQRDVSSIQPPFQSLCVHWLTGGSMQRLVEGKGGWWREGKQAKGKRNKNQESDMYFKNLKLFKLNSSAGTSDLSREILRAPRRFPQTGWKCCKNWSHRSVAVWSLS